MKVFSPSKHLVNQFKQRAKELEKLSKLHLERVSKGKEGRIESSLSILECEKGLTSRNKTGNLSSICNKRNKSETREVMIYLRFISKI